MSSAPIHRKQPQLKLAQEQQALEESRQQDKIREIVKINPATGEEIARIPISTKEDVVRAVSRARTAFSTWRNTPLKRRLEILTQLKGVIEELGEQYAKQISLDTGKPPVDSLMTELISIPMFIDYYRKWAPKVLRRRKVSTPLVFFGKKSYVESFPMGVIAVISPWNFPFQLSVLPILSALIAGNTVVLKPSEVTPLTGEIIEGMFGRIGLPPGVVQVVQGDGSTGAALVESDVDKIFFTGSVATVR